MLINIKSPKSPHLCLISILVKTLIHLEKTAFTIRHDRRDSVPA